MVLFEFSHQVFSTEELKLKLYMKLAEVVCNCDNAEVCLSSQAWLSEAFRSQGVILFML